MLSLCLGVSGCSIRGYATRVLADSLSQSGTGFASDPDPELVHDAVPFALKTMEQILAEQPRHTGLLTALASGFTSYTYAFVQQEADEVEAREVALAAPIKRRAKGLYLRARDYGLRGLEVRHPGLASALKSGEAEGGAARRDALLAAVTAREVPLLYWTAASWALGISAGRDEMHLVGQLPAVEALMARAAALDPDYDEGAIDEFYVSYDGGKDGAAAAARQHLERAQALCHGQRLGGPVSFAETVDVAAQNRAEFKDLLEKVVAYDVDQAEGRRLANLIAQRRARWLLARIEELFAE